MLLDSSDYDNEKEMDEAEEEILEAHYANFSDVKYHLVDKTVIDWDHMVYSNFGLNGI